MDKMCSYQIAIPSIISLILGGVTVWFLEQPSWAYLLWGVALIWSFFFWIYRKQKVWVTIISEDIQRDSVGNIRIMVKGFIESRHPDGLDDLELYFNPAIGLNSLKDSDIPHSVTDSPQRFRVTYEVSKSLIEQSIMEQQTDGSSVLWIFCANMRSADWLSIGDPIPNIIFDNGIERLGMRRRTTMIAKRRRKGLGINKEQFRTLLPKVSHPIKKPNSEQ
jgi:hypothetical protein